MLPTFLVIGAMKAGTTSLHRYLGDHPEVFMSVPKELRFFSGENWGRGLDWYKDHFADAGDAVAVGESSPAYSQADIFPDAAPRILEHLPWVQLLYVVREPVSRMRSMWVHLAASGRERRPCAEALRDDPVYLNCSRYRWQLDRYLPHVGLDRVRVITSEALRSNRAATLSEVFAFVGADAAWSAPSLAGEHHRSETKRRRTWVSRRLGRYDWYRSASGYLPEPVRRATRVLTTRSVTGSASELSPALVAELSDRLAPDVAGLRELLPPDWDGWGIA